MNMPLFILITLTSFAIIWTGCKKSEVEQTTVHISNPTGSFTDIRDDEIYATVTINNQTWMSENLRYNATGSYNRLVSSDSIYGRLYNWLTIMNGENYSSNNPSGIQGICPQGWHIPSLAEWNTFKNAISVNDPANALKSTIGWSNEANGTNHSGFNAFPNGVYKSAFNSFAYLGDQCYFWSTTDVGFQFTGVYVYSYNLNFNNSAFNKMYGTMTDGYSCRCVQN
jgi:uncharacterized protein (TIGR02145 family)